MTAMAAARIHNTTRGDLIVAGHRIASGRSLELDLEVAGDLPRGAYVNPRDLTAAAPTAEAPAADIIRALETATADEAAATRDAEAAGKARTTVIAAAEARLAELAQPDPADTGTAPTDTVEESTP